MEGQKKQFAVLCVLVLVCVAAYFGLKAYNEKTEEQKQQEADDKKTEAVSIETDNIKSFSYQAAGNTLTFEKEGDIWYYQPDHSIKIDQSIISSMLSVVKKVTAEEKLENVKDTSEYGFAEPANVLTFELKDGTRTITIGMQNDITNEYYIMNDKCGTIYIVNDGLSSAFSKTIEEVTAAEETTEENTTGENAAGQ